MYVTAKKTIIGIQLQNSVNSSATIYHIQQASYKRHQSAYAEPDFYGIPNKINAFAHNS